MIAHGPSVSNRIRTLVVDDSPFLCKLISTFLSADPEIEVVATAHSGEKALLAIHAHKPDVMTLDLEMPGMDGLTVLQRVMSESPTATVLISGITREAASVTLAALQQGAVDFVIKYVPGVNSNPIELQKEIIQKVKQAARVKVIRNLPQRKLLKPLIPVPPQAKPVRSKRGNRKAIPRGGLIVIGASTGGPIALRELLSEFPADFPAAIVVVQHMPATFTRVFSEQLDQTLALKVREAASGDRLEPGTILVAPGDWHVNVQSDGRIDLHQGPKCDGHRPAIDVTMKSAAQAFGSKVKGVLLTGMGCDGAEGLQAIYGVGGTTFVQDAESSVVNGMPQKARELGVVDYEGTPVELAHFILEHVYGHKKELVS